ncbi:MAG: tol-pal system protein YbgF [Micavibrio aeruginosavorus]|uniref:Tol-pal system protein YbgF n=1 Tax=Micavibrio aeruginosavorus TaxID=349221 RepID=A0A2W5FNC7_9BACT|nr:MAG: tol-pal system protein YbgF [Micavibrio aeruginosavorus]
MKAKHSFSGRPFSIFLAALFLSTAAFAQVNEAPVRYGNGGFAPTDLSSSSSDDMTGGVVASPSGAPSSNSYQANLEVRLSDLENQMRTMRGQLEEKDFQINQLKTQLEKSLSDIEMRLGNGGVPTSGAGVVSPPSNNGSLQTNDYTDAPPQPNADPNAPATNSPTTQNLGSINQAPNGVPIAPSSGDAASQYESAFAKLKSGDYATAQVEFDQFLKKNPSHQLAANATYWYGETFYAQQKYSESTRIFAESYKKYPKGPKAADSLLKLGMSLGGAGKTKEACVALKQLKKQYPAGSSTVLKRADSEISKLACS